MYTCKINPKFWQVNPHDAAFAYNLVVVALRPTPAEKLALLQSNVLIKFRLLLPVMRPMRIGGVK